MRKARIQNRHFLNYAALEQAPLRKMPCPHLVVEEFIPREVMAHISTLLPPLASGGSFPPESLPLPPDLVAMIEDFQGSRLKKIVSDKFGIAVQDAPTMLTLRGRTRAKDGQIHRDSSAKRVTILLYLNPPDQKWDKEGCLRFTNGPHDIEDYSSEVPPAGGTLVIFPNGPATWHGHRQYVGPRYTIQLNYMADNHKARYELTRHKISAFWKKIAGSFVN